MFKKLKELFDGKDVGIRPDYNLIGLPPIPPTRFERRKEQRRYLKAKRR